MKVGSLFTGILGLDWPWLGEHHAWTVENDPDALTVLAERLPGVPNLGDITEVDWSKVEPVDVLIGGGFPCQPFSTAGNQKGAADERYLWPEVVRAVRNLGPRLVVLENTPTVASRTDGLPRFASDLAEIGYDLRWASLRASDVGAPHRRNRWLAIAHPQRRRIRPDARAGGEHQPGRAAVSSRSEMAQPADAQPNRLLPTPQASDGSRGPDYARQRDRRASHGSGGDDLTTTVAKLLPTPTAMDSHGSRRDTARRDHWDSNPGTTLGDVAHSDAWGNYGGAVARWAALAGPPPPPAEDGKLSPRFVEWMMGFPSGWASDLIPRRAALRVLGNAVVPLVASHALDELTRPLA